MSKIAKRFVFLFLALALAALGDDIYVWYNSDNFPFAFAALGWIIKTYAPDQLQMVADFIGVQTFNRVFTPVLAIPAFFLSLGLAGLVFLTDMSVQIVKAKRAQKQKQSFYLRK